MTDSELFDVKYPPTDQDVEDSMTLPSEAGEGLKACPFCGGEAHVWGRTWWAVKCQTCVFGRDDFLTREAAIDHWNRRRATPTGKAARRLAEITQDLLEPGVLEDVLGLYPELAKRLASALHQQGGTNG